MSRYLSDKYRALTPYVPGEQPRDMRYIKLNTNESPYPPSPLAQEYAAKAAQRQQLYCDPDCTALRQKLAALYGITPDEVILTNGSDEALNFAFMAFCDGSRPAAFPDITYGFYPVFADLYGVPYIEIPLSDDFTVNVDDYIDIGMNIFLANPNAPTGLALPLSDIERIIASNPDNIVLIDEAYVDFGTESAVGLIDRYDNLIVTRTFSKSRSLAGARLGMAIACPALIADLNALKYATNPYNVNGLTQAAGLGSLEDEAYTQRNCREIVMNRERLSDGLRTLGFILTQSATNFVFAKHPDVGGAALYAALRQRGVLVRHFNIERIKDYNRITVGTGEQVDAVLRCITEILEDR